MKTARLCLIGTIVVMCASARPAMAQGSRTLLTAGWHIQSSEKVKAGGDTISTSTFRAVGWYRASMPSTVLAALVANNVYADPFFGMNLRSIPGTGYPIGKNFSNVEMPADSPFRASWWFRTAFPVDRTVTGRRTLLHFDGVNYRANIWLNGRQLAASDRVAGTYRLYEFDVTDAVKHGAANVLAVEVFPPTPDDLAWTWVDWNPVPPDKNMGLWRPVYLTTSGDVVVRHPHVVSHLTAGQPEADLTVSAEIRNLAERAVHGVVRGRIEQVRFEQAVDLAPGEETVVKFQPDQFAQLRLPHPRLWWPAELGTPNLYRLELTFHEAGRLSDQRALDFGIREITSDITPDKVRLFKINGRPLLIRGGGWAPDMLLRSTPERQEAELRYVRDMRLNTIRLEGKLEDDHFFDLADRYGILILPGWCCCDVWEQWPKWKPETRDIAAASQRDQIRRLRSHPSVLAWLNGSDNPPPADVEQMYIDILRELDWPNPYVSSATQKETTVTGGTGVKMTGPYDWVPPSYWLHDEAAGGASGFNTETSPGPAVPPIESLRRMLPADHHWPIDDVWNYHAGGGQFKTLQIFSDALSARYGKPSSAEDYATKAQLMTYEGERAMFEAFARNKYRSTGVIQWMLNNAWPSMIWHLYDYYLRPAGGYFGAKKACEPVHVQYSYDDRSIVIVNGTEQPLSGKLVARVVNTDASERFAREVAVALGPDATSRVATIPEREDFSSTHFLDLRLLAPNGRLISTNLYWLSTTPEDLDWPKSTWYTTPVKQYADFTALNQLPAARVATSAVASARGDQHEVHVTVRNPGRTLAFFIRLQIVKAGGEEVLPVLWQDNYVTLMPGETRVVTATFNPRDAGGAAPRVVISGWNVKRQVVVTR